MKTLTISLILLVLLGCTTKTQYGKCTGLNGHEDPKLTYEYSAWNIAVGIFFFGLIVPPVMVALDGLKCPVGSN
jgi:hypothetical protein